MLLRLELPRLLLKDHNRSLFNPHHSQFHLLSTDSGLSLRLRRSDRALRSAWYGLMINENQKRIRHFFVHSTCVFLCVFKSFLRLNMQFFLSKIENKPEDRLPLIVNQATQSSQAIQSGQATQLNPPSQSSQATQSNPATQSSSASQSSPATKSNPTDVTSSTCFHERDAHYQILT